MKGWGNTSSDREKGKRKSKGPCGVVRRPDAGTKGFLFILTAGTTCRGVALLSSTCSSLPAPPFVSWRFGEARLCAVPAPVSWRLSLLNAGGINAQVDRRKSWVPFATPSGTEVSTRVFCVVEHSQGAAGWPQRVPSKPACPSPDED